jgi:hypothetical protein
MRSSNLLALLTLGAALALSTACSQAKTMPEPVAAATPADAREQLEHKARAASLASVSEGEKRPAFSKETVLKLNPIVERSKKALDRLDQLTPQLAAARAAGDKAGIAAITVELGRLKTETDAAHVAFQTEKTALIGRKEYYDELILAAMEQFVTEAPGEIADTLAAASK